MHYLQARVYSTSNPASICKICQKQVPERIEPQLPCLMCQLRPSVLCLVWNSFTVRLDRRRGPGWPHLVAGINIRNQHLMTPTTNLCKGAVRVSICWQIFLKSCRFVIPLLITRYVQYTALDWCRECGTAKPFFWEIGLSLFLWSICCSKKGNCKHSPEQTHSSFPNKHSALYSIALESWSGRRLWGKIPLLSVNELQPCISLCSYVELCSIAEGRA